MTETTLDGYQLKAVKTAIYPIEAQVTYPAMGLANEAGEVLGKVKKIIRDGTYNREDIVDELGDVLWYAAALARDLDVSLTEVAHRNLEKLASREKRGTLQGSGDKR
jgi:NTP pyrophosphatase (non-canonical NTP hydrolase)